mmetsp:Transcript_4953/g.4154  ORF Transcript_4953/g.4154 Transcript_4953/m.4154 type:complete len:93 (+) Transcript_4953:703-981(+)
MLYLSRYRVKVRKLQAKRTILGPSDYSVAIYNLGYYHEEFNLKYLYGDKLSTFTPLHICRLKMTYNIEKWVNKIRTLDQVIKERDEAIRNQE